MIEFSIMMTILCAFLVIKSGFDTENSKNGLRLKLKTQIAKR